MTEGIIEAPKQYTNESSDNERNKSNALHNPLRHLRSLSYYDRLKFAFKLFGSVITIISLILDYMYVSKSVFMND